MDYFDEFKPIRNKIRRLHLNTTLERIHLMKGRGEVLPEVAEFLFVNVLLYSEALNNPKQHHLVLNDVLRSCSKLMGKVYSKNIDSIVWRWLHALALTQLKSHYNSYINATYRYFLIFSEPQLKLHIEQCIDIAYEDYLRCSLWLHAVFSRKLRVPKSYFLNKKKR